jgi:hypothetical protein
MRCSELAIFLLLAELEPEIEISFRVVQDATQTTVFGIPAHRHPVGGGPNQLLGLCFRIRDCPFPAAGLYWVECWNYTNLLHRQRLYAVE